MSNGAPTGNELEFKPYVPASESPRELTVQAVVVGTALGLIFSASSLYLVMKVGMTVSASIPVAVLAISLFRAFSRSTILENNIVQTAGSAGESIAFGVGVTMPALLMLGFDMSLARVMVVSILGGLLGILAMIPLRRAFIVKMHGRPGQPGTLLYPEGVAAAQVLISGDKGGTTGITVFVGFGIAFLHKFFTLGFNVIKETVAIPIGAINKAAVFSADMASELLGVGYIIGYRTSAVMMAGAVLGYLVIIPTVFFIGEHAPKAIAPSTTKAISEMNIGELRNNYLLYIGAGCVATAGLLSMLKTLPIIVRSVTSGLRSMQAGGEALAIKRTDNDMPMSVVLLGTLGLLVLLTIFLMTEVAIVSAIAGALLVVVFGFLFVTVSSRLTGEIGSSSNPISGMTVATLMVTCLIFLALGWRQPQDRLLALSIAAVVCIASSNGGTTAQSLKTGFLVGGTPKAMQYAILIGALISALVIGGTLLLFNNAGTYYSDDPAYLPKDKDGKVVVLSAEELARLKQPNDAGKTQSPEKYKPESEKDEAERPEKEYLVWDTRRDEFTGGGYVARKELIKVPEGTAPEGRFLVDPDTGAVAFVKDPTIGGVIKNRPVRVYPKLAKDLSVKVTHEGKQYVMLTVADPSQVPGLSAGNYLVEPESRFVRWVAVKDKAGEYEAFKGPETTRFDAPKTKVMHIIIDGVLNQKLNWSLVLIGAMIAFTLELCGVSALAFAVGVYVPIQYSVPIFLGGIVRWGVDKYLSSTVSLSRNPGESDSEFNARSEIEAIRRSETSPGVLLASGYIAGGSLAGVVAAFLEFPIAKSVKDVLNRGRDVEKLSSETLFATPFAFTMGDLISVALFAGLIAFAVFVGMGKVLKTKDDTA